MAEELDKELQAINQIIKALESLEVDEKKRVIEYVFTRLGLQSSHPEGLFVRKRDVAPLLPESTTEHSIPESNATGTGAVIDIRTLTEEKDPKSAIEMAAVVAFYLSELAPTSERKQVIGAEDITKYFKQASFKLPNGGNSKTLRNAKNAGYLDSTGELGIYRLNPVGYNLVAYSMPKAKRTLAKRRVSKKASTPKKKD